TVSGLPSGATAGFNPSTVSGGSGSSTLTVSTASTTPGGSYTLTITGTSGTLVHTSTVTLVVAQPDFSLSASPRSLTINRRHSNSANTTITVTPISSFGGTVALSVSGLPAGVTATFTPTQV